MGLEWDGEVEFMMVEKRVVRAETVGLHRIRGG